MKRISSRMYQDQKDFQVMVDLLSAVRPREHLQDFPIQVDLEENLASETVRANTRLWFHGEQPIGWAFVDEFSNIWWEVQPQYEELLGSEVIAWGEACVRKMTAGGAATLDTSCREDYAARIAFLQQHGFQPTDTTTLRMVRDLSQPIPEPVLPPGFTIRPLAGTQEAEAVAAMHRAAFGTDYMTTENRLAIMNTGAYDLSLDLIVIAPDGTIAANCICSVNEREKRGATDPVATHPDYQGKGLARALLARGMQLLRERGMSFAQFGTSGSNIAMQKTGEAVGFQLEYKILWLSKDVC